MTLVRNSEANVIQKERLSDNGKKKTKLAVQFYLGQGGTRPIEHDDPIHMTDDKVREIQRHNQAKATVRLFLNTKLSVPAWLHIFNHSHTPCLTSFANKLECSGYVNICRMEPFTGFSTPKTDQGLIQQITVL